MKFTELEKERWQTSSVRRGRGTIIDESARIYHAGNTIIGEDSYIGPLVYMRGQIKIGNDCWVGPMAQLNGEFGIEMGNSVGIGNGVIILTSEHDKTKSSGKITLAPLKSGKVVIKSNVIVGCGACIIPGVTIEEGATIGMGAVVTKNVPKNETWVGNPARKIASLREAI